MGDHEHARGAWVASVVLRDFPDELVLARFEDEAPAGHVLLSPGAARARIDAWMGSGRAEPLTLVRVAGLVGQAAPETLAQRQALENQLTSALQSGSLRLFARRMPPPLAARPPEGPSRSAPPPLPPATPTPELTWFELTVLDEVGDPIGGLEVVLSAAGKAKKLKTSSAGVVRWDGVEASFADAQIADVKALREKLQPRWTTPRKQRLPKASVLFVREFGLTVDGARLENEAPATLVITPYFRCREIPGSHFDFGRSFVRREAIQTLSEIFEDVAGLPIRKLMLFAHTDRSGPEALNKELSERRAKALYALATHDDGAWEDLFTNKPSGGNWSESWGTKEVQHMLNALSCGDDAGAPLAEHGKKDAPTLQAIRRFQRGDYPAVPAEQAPLDVDGDVGPRTRKELFLAYAKRIARDPLPKDRIAKVNGEAYMGCGEYNPLSLSAKDAQSRRAVAFVFDAAAEPQALPCKLRSLAPCKANVAPEPVEADPGGSPPYRCKVYQGVAELCPCNGGADLSHDLIVQLPFTLQEANEMPHVLVVESEDGTIVIAKTLAGDARAHDAGFIELFFPDLPPHHAYRMRCEGTDAPHVVFDYTPYEDLTKMALGRDATTPTPFLS